MILFNIAVTRTVASQLSEWWQLLDIDGARRNLTVRVGTEIMTDSEVALVSLHLPSAFNTIMQGGKESATSALYMAKSSCCGVPNARFHLRPNPTQIHAQANGTYRRAWDDMLPPSSHTTDHSKVHTPSHPPRTLLLAGAVREKAHVFGGTESTSSFCAERESDAM